MKKIRRLIPLIAVLVMGLCIHASSAWAEGASPSKIVKEFARAYFMLDSSMAAYLSKDARFNEDDVDMVDLYLEIKAFEAYNRGYKLSYLKKRPTVMKIKVLNIDDSSAKIQFDAITLRSINRLYGIVGVVFGLLEEHEVQDIITLVKEDGEWKIGPGTFDLPM